MGQALSKLGQVQPQYSLINNNEGNLSLSTYTGELTKKTIDESLMRIKFAFSDLPIEFYLILQERVKSHNFSDSRLLDAVNNVIDNCIYPKPTIAQFISFDRRIQVYTHDQMTKKMSEYGQEIWNSYKAVKLDGMIKPVWIHVNDIERYKIESL